MASSSPKIENDSSSNLVDQNRKTATPSGDVSEAGHHLRTLTLFDGISTIVSLMVGSGIFSTAGEIQKAVGSAGFSLTLWLITGILALTGALCYAELGTMIPGSGGEAQYLSQAFGPLMVFLFNWTSIMILKPGTIAILSVATAQYGLQMASNIFSFSLGSENSPLFVWGSRGLAIVVCVIVTLASSLSTKWSNRIQSILTFGKIGALTLIILSGLYYAIFVDSSQVSSNLGRPFQGTQFHFSSIAVALTSGLWAFEGWNNLNIVAGDLANPRVNLPLSIWISMVAVVILYLMTLLGYYAVLPKAQIALTQTVGIDFGMKVFGYAGNIIMPLLIASSTFGSALSSMVTSSEIIVLAANTGQIPRYFKKISPTLGTAARAYWLQCILSAILVLLTEFKGLLMVYTFPTWIFYASCVIALLKFRITAPKMERPYRVLITTPILFLCACLFLQVTTFWAEPVFVGVSLGVVLAGIPTYFLFGMHQNKSLAAAVPGSEEKSPTSSPKEQIKSPVQ